MEKLYLHAKAIKDYHAITYLCPPSSLPSHSVQPFLVKNCINVKSFPMDISSHEIQKLHYHCSEDAPIISLLRNQFSYFPVGYTNVPPFCVDIQSNSSVHGICCNPYRLDRSSGGSSGGSAVAVRFGITDMALGTDLAGSLRIPAHFCGIFSLRPTYQPIFVQGSVPPFFNDEKLFANQEERNSFLERMKEYQTDLNECELFVMGPMTRTIEAMKEFGDVMSKAKIWKPSSLQSQPRKLRIAITTHFSSIETDVRIQQAIQLLKTRFKENSDLFECIDEIDETKLGMEWSKLIHIYKELSKPIVAAVESYTAVRNSQKTVTNSTANARLTYHINPKMKQLQLEYKAKMKQFMNQYDIWILPVASTLAFAHNPQHHPIPIQTETGQEKLIHYWKNISYCTPISVLGNPVLTVPIAMDSKEHLPIGVQCVGNYHCENELIAMAQEFLKKGWIACLPEPNLQLKSHY